MQEYKKMLKISNLSSEMLCIWYWCHCSSGFLFYAASKDNVYGENPKKPENNGYVRSTEIVVSCSSVLYITEENEEAYSPYVTDQLSVN